MTLDIVELEGHVSTICSLRGIHDPEPREVSLTGIHELHVLLDGIVDLVEELFGNVGVIYVPTVDLVPEGAIEVADNIYLSSDGTTYIVYK